MWGWTFVCHIEGITLGEDFQEEAAEGESKRKLENVAYW